MNDSTRSIVSPVRRVAALITAAVVGLVVSGCTAASDEDSASGSSSIASVTSDASTSAGATTENAAPSEDANVSPGPTDQPFVANTKPDTGETVGAGMLLLAKVRFAAQDGYDRVVLEYAGSGTPGWDVRYTDAASRQGSGDPITLPGSALLQVTVNGTTYPNESQTTVSSGAISVTTTTVTGIYIDGNFEGQDQAIIGTKGKQPFRVFAVANPPRLVIDVQS